MAGRKQQATLEQELLPTTEIGLVCRGRRRSKTCTAMRDKSTTPQNPIQREYRRKYYLEVQGMLAKHHSDVCIRCRHCGQARFPESTRETPKAAEDDAMHGSQGAGRAETQSQPTQTQDTTESNPPKHIKQIRTKWDALKNNQDALKKIVGTSHRPKWKKPLQALGRKPKRCVSNKPR